MLTPLEMLEGNAKIAEFLGVQTTELGYYDAEEVIPNEEDNTFDILHFHERLDWLTPAMDKIEELGYSFSIHNGYVDILNDKKETLITSDEGNWAEMVFSAIVLWLSL